MDTGADVTVVKQKKRKGNPTPIDSELWDGELVPNGSHPDWLVVYHSGENHKRRKLDKSGEHGKKTKVPQHVFHWFWCGNPIAARFDYDGHGRLTRAKCDASLPVELSLPRVSFVDLDIDLVTADMKDCPLEGVVTLRDVTPRDIDVLLKRATKREYSDYYVDSAWAGIRLGYELIGRRECPFDQAARALMDDALGSSRAVAHG